MEYRLTKTDLLQTLGLWNRFLNKKVHLIACGGTAMTLWGIKESTKDVDLLIPIDQEYDYLIKTLKQLGYTQETGSGWRKEGEVFIFDLFKGKRVHTTELLESSIEKENHVVVKELSYIYIGILNEYDLIVSKLFRGTTVDVEDCLMLFRARRNEIKMERLKERYMETAKYDIAEDRLIKNWENYERVFKEACLSADKEKFHGQ